MLCFVLVSVAGCGDDDDSAAPGGGGADGLAVINSDFMSTSISLVDPETLLLTQDNCINSGTRAPGLSLALSGDIALPSAVQPEHELLLIDRTNSALTWLDPKTCEVSCQLAVGTGFFANPHDVVALGPDKAYVTRFERNEAPSGDEDDLDGGDDILVIDPKAAEVLARIPLGDYATTVDGAEIWARPDRAMLHDGRVYVALANLSADFNSAGEGRILVLDAQTDSVVSMVDLPGLKNCTGLGVLPAEDSLIVVCGGSFADGPTQVDGSAIVTIDVSARQPVIKSTLKAEKFDGRPLSSLAFAATSANEGLIVTYGDSSGSPPDTLWSWDLKAGTATQREDAGGSFVYGSMWADVDRARVFLSDSTMDEPRVHVWDLSADPVIEQSFESNPALGLPPQSIGAY